MLELLFLLLPVAAAYGWFMGRNSVRHEQRKEQEQFSRKYVAGLNLLLSDQSDKAVDMFIEMLDVDSETIETHWTLGKLFRRRGELERAIRIHQNLISRPSLTEHDRQHAMFELGQDYLAAGLYDRAENMFADLQKQSEYRMASQRSLLSLYESTNEWNKAIKVALKLARYDRKLKPVVAQLYCELADLQSNPKDKIKFNQQALQHDKACIRARLNLAHHYAQQAQYKQVLEYLYPIKDLEPDFIAEALPLLQEAYRELGDQTGLVQYLHDVISQHPCASAVMMLADIISERNDNEAAEQFMLAALGRNPTMRGFHKLIDLHVQSANQGRERDSLLMLRNLVGEQVKQRARYSCRQCGFSAQSLFWHCPSCRHWGSIKPTRGLDGE